MFPLDHVIPLKAPAPGPPDGRTYTVFNVLLNNKSSVHVNSFLDSLFFNELVTVHMCLSILISKLQVVELVPPP